MVKQKISNLIAGGRIEEAIQLLLTITAGTDELMYNELIVLSSQISANNRRNSSGLLDYDKFKMNENHILTLLVDYLNQIDSKGYFENLDMDTLLNKVKDTENKKQKILFIASNPIGTPTFELEKEYLGIRKIFYDKRKEFELIELFDTKLDDLFKYIQKEEPQIIHISAPSTQEHLYLHEEDNTISKVPYKFLSSAFSMFSNFTQCVFLNTQTSPVFLKRISKSLPYAIGCEGLISDENSILFSSGFYTGLSLNKSIEESFQLGIQVLKNSKRQSDQGLDTLLLFHSGYCLNKEDTFPESF